MIQEKKVVGGNISALYRFYTIDQILCQEKRISLEKLWRKVESNYRQIERNENRWRYSKETLRKDIRDMRKLFNAPIVCDRRTNEYFYAAPFTLRPLQISKEELLALNLVNFVLEKFSFFSSVKKIHQFIQDLLAYGESCKQVHSVIHLPEILGNKLLFPCFEAIVKQLKITFEYKSNNAIEKSKRQVSPYQLKFYDNVWYLLAFDDNQLSFRIFRLDKIQNLTITSEIFTYQNSFEIEKYQKNAIGIFSIEERPPQPIVIKVKCSKEAAHRFAGLLKSQYIKPHLIEEKEQNVLFAFEAIKNQDLMITFLKLMDQIEVLEPIALRKEFKEEVKKILSRYL
jgi:predicted DNA-binding transcriptional regulator YafY